VYAREIGERTLMFGVSGMLFRDGLVMFDRQTDTLWTQVDGRGVRGPLAGRALAIVPSVHATWAEWKRLYPDSEILKKGAMFRSPYESYARSGRIGVTGRRNPDDRLAGKTRILGVRHDGDRAAYPIDRIREARLVHDTVGDVPIVLAAPARELPVVLFDRRVDGRTLTFTLSEDLPAHLRDEETGSLWDVAAGAALEGPLKGRQLERVSAVPAFWFGWAGYFPNSRIWGEEVER
jgi:hypothetical protein